MLRITSAITALAWSYLLFAMVVVTFTEPNSRYTWLFAIALILAACCVIAAAVYSTFKSTRAIPPLLFIVSLAPGYLFASAMWRFHDSKGARSLEVLLRGDYPWHRLIQDVVFIGLPICWAVVCFGLLRQRRLSET